MNCLLPEIVDPRAPRGLPIREPDYIVQVNTGATLNKSKIYMFKSLSGAEPEEPEDMTVGLSEHSQDARQTHPHLVEHFEEAAPKEETTQKQGQKQSQGA